VSGVEEPYVWPGIVGVVVVHEEPSVWWLRLELEHGVVLVPLLGLLAAGAALDEGLNRALADL